jgi:hypothetical protein
VGYSAKGVSHGRARGVVERSCNGLVSLLT